MLPMPKFSKPFYDHQLQKKAIFNDPRVISYDIERTFDPMSANITTIATIKMNIDPNNFDPTFPAQLEGSIGALQILNEHIMFIKGWERIDLGPVNDPNSYKAIMEQIMLHYYQNDEQK